MRIRDARQSEAASDAASVFNHKVDVCGPDEGAYTSHLGGSGYDYRLAEGPSTQVKRIHHDRIGALLLMFENTISVGCGGGLPCIAYSQNRARKLGKSSF